MASFKLDAGTTALLNIAYPEVEKKLSVKAVDTKYKQFISKFIEKRPQLYANIFNKQTYYSVDDIKDWYTFTNIDKKIIAQSIKESYYGKVANFKPLCAKDDHTMALLCAVRYYHLNNKQQELNFALINLSFSGKIYPSIFYKAFRFEPADYVMDYVLNNMLTNKYAIVKFGNVISTIKNTADTWLDAYKDRFKAFTDEDAVYLIQQLYNRIDALVYNISTLYYEAYKNKDNFLVYDTDDLSEDNYHIADNDSYKIGRIVENAVREITTKNVDYINCKRASNDIVKFDELKTILDALIANQDNVPLIKEYITLSVSLYFKENSNKDIKDISFISYSIKPAPNSKDQYIVKKKDLLTQLLLNNSENFARRRNRKATESAYYRAFNAYLALMIQKANK